ncbi:hypothetical protein [Pseudomonas sp. P42]|uniref:hypothetical protein n=1 Tax=Pseudomonas sp. P42 TaxID=1080160 RepID=UPI001B3453AC|nr:hypothetical protein [Pseudomonas sp. P42]MBP5954021.1 hypothetical protein [Pseudomonas sp. P42]
MIGFGSALLVIGLGIILYASDVFGYSKSVKLEISRLKSAEAPNKEQRHKLMYYKSAIAARVIGGIAIAVGLIIIAIFN